MLASFYSPMTHIPRQIPWAESRSREIICTFAIFALGPTVIFWAWFLLQGRHGIHDGYENLVFAMPISSLWITLGPILMQRGEFELEKLISALNEPEIDEEWDMQAIQRAILRADRIYYWITLPLAFAAVASVWWGAPAISSIVKINGVAAQLGGIIVICSVGFASASGMWGCYKALSIVRAATRATSWQWLPFRPQQSRSVRALHEFCWAMALIFSLGNLSLPTLFVVQAELPSLTRGIVVIFVAILAVGGLVLFTVPIRWLRKHGDIQKEQLLEALAAPIEHSQEAVLSADSYSVLELRRRDYVLNMALTLRTAISSLNPIPWPQLVTRGAATLILPLVLSILQLAVTRLL